MENVYAFGTSIIQIILKSFSKHENFFMGVNNAADPNYTNLILFPLISVFDTALASEFILVTAIGNWINCILKWILNEHRPYWWVRETRYYGPMRDNKPFLRIGPQTCETGPGCPSGHVMNVTTVMLMFYYWAAIAASRREEGKRAKYEKLAKSFFWVVGPICVLLTSTSRMFIAAHFPHQCLLGAIFGLLTPHFVTSLWINRFMNADRTSDESQDVYRERMKKWMMFNVSISMLMMILSFATYWGQKLFGMDPSWSVKLAFKWCTTPEYLHYDTTPFYTLVQSVGTTLGWALCVTPGIKKYETKSLPVAAIATLVAHQIFWQWKQSLSKDSATYFYLLNFFIFALRPVFFLRIIPFFANLPKRHLQTNAAVEAADKTKTE